MFRQDTVQAALQAALSQKELDVNHLQAAIWREDRLVFEGVANRLAVGPIIHTKSLFRLASVSKPVTALGILRLMEQGKLALDAPLQTYLPQLPAPLKPLTCRQLLTHTSGLRHYENKVASDSATGQQRSCREALKVFASDPLFATPGQKYHYSTHAFTLLGAVAEAVMNRPFFETQQALFRSLGLRDLGFESLPSPPDASRVGRRAPLYNAQGTEETKRQNLSWKWPGGGMESTASDLVSLFGKTLQGKVLKPATWEQMQRRQPPPREPASDDPAMGLGIFLRAEGLNHSGSQQGTSSFLLILPSTRTVAAVLCNTQGRKVSDLCRSLEKLSR
jgi:serine beta-lactamase-like protein LACTB, mitochondrial